MPWCSARRLASANIFWKPASDRMFSRADNATVTSLMACVRSFSTACSFRDTGNRRPAKFSRMTSPTTNSNRSPQNNAFGAIAVQLWCILSYIRILKRSKNFLGDGRLGRPRPPRPPLNTPLSRPPLTSRGSAEFRKLYVWRRSVTKWVFLHLRLFQVGSCSPTARCIYAASNYSK